MKFRGVLATRSDDQRLYVLLGSGFARPLSSGDPDTFTSDWLAAHTAARIRPISRMFVTNRLSKQTSEIVYIWIEDGKDCLNVDMVRSGLFPASAMYDMVDNLNGLNRLLERDPKLADARAEIEKERAEAPQDRTERLIASDDYHKRLRRVDKAEALARAEKRGVWSDAMRDERQSDGYP